MKAIITGSEPEELRQIQKIVGDHCPEIQLLAVVSDRHEAGKFIREQKPDVVFLNDEIPDDGQFPFPEEANPFAFQTVLISASDRFARQVASPCLYHHLSKPINGDELAALVARLKKRVDEKTSQAVGSVIDNHGRTAFSENLRIPVKEGVFFCPIADIIRIESGGSYSILYVSGGKRYVVSKGLKEYEEMLQVREFFRVHRSHLVNLHRIRKYTRADGNFLEMEDGKVIEVARRKKGEFQKLMDILN